MSSILKLSVLAGIVATLPATAADLLISEYVEGSSNNKAIELYNPNDSAVALNNYAFQFYFNGGNSAGLTINLTGTIAAKSTHVLAHASSAAELLALAQQTAGGAWFNGDDAIVLVNNGVVIDAIGQVGVDPGTAWTDGSVSTIDMTLRRTKAEADSNSSDVFVASSQWTAFPINTFSDLGKAEFGSVTPPNPLGQCGDPFVTPHDIQGAQLASQMVGQTVVAEAIVSADFRGSEKLRGVYMQSPTYEYDNDNSTSEALFVYDPNNTINVAVGTRIRVLASVAEFDGQTQLTPIKSWLDCGAGNNLSAAPLVLPVSDNNALEANEGMLVSSTSSLTVADTYNLARYGEVMLSAGGRLWQPTEVAAPGIDAQVIAKQNVLRRILLDDGSTRQNPARIPYPGNGLTHDNTLRVGDEVRPFAAVLSQAFSAYRLHPIETPIFDARNQRAPLQTRQQDTTIRVASFNVLNYFNGDGVAAGFPTSRGASSGDELFRQREKMLAALSGLDADVIGLMEVENDGDKPYDALTEIVDYLNQRSVVGSVWKAINTGLLGSDEIRVALIYRDDRVAPLGSAERLQTGAFATANRVPLLQKFAQRGGVQTINVVVNHFKSKGSCPSDSQDANADKGDGQSCWNVLRTQAAHDLMAWLAPKAKQERIVLIGDFNAYRKEDPITALNSGAYALLNVAEGESSYVFDGQSGQLDHGLANSRLNSEVLATHHWAINADEPRALDYNVEFKTAQQQLELYAATPARSSDHDPLVIDIGQRQFSQHLRNQDWRLLWGKAEQRFKFVAQGDGNAEAMAMTFRVLHAHPETLRVVLRSPQGVETPLSMTFEGDAIKTATVTSLLPAQALAGTWQLIVRPTQLGLGLVVGAELKLD